MKKQILILTFFVAAIFAGTSTAFAQLNPGVTDPLTTNNPIDPLSCIGTSLPLHPMPGVPYTYVMDGTTGPEQVATWTWFATKDSSFIDGGVLNTSNELTVASGDLLSVSTNYGSANAGGTIDSVTIEWSSSILARTEYEAVANISGVPPSPTFVVGYAEGVNCADNIEVFEINPVPAFVIDIANVQGVTTLDWDVPDSSCVSEVESATYNSALDSLMMDYGSDTLIFEVAAANFVTNFTPTLTLVSGLTGSQTSDISIHTTLSDAQNYINPLGSGIVTDFGVSDSTSFGGVDLTAADPLDINTGVSFWVTVVIHNNTFESLARQPFVLAVDGLDATDQWDMDDDDCADPSLATYDVDDQATHTILPRPTVVPDLTPMGEGNGTDPDTVIEKQRN